MVPFITTLLPAEEPLFTGVEGSGLTLGDPAIFFFVIFSIAKRKHCHVVD
jgi:hypothetical protein